VRLLLCLLLCAPWTGLTAALVQAEAHDAFWLWAGVRPQPVLAQAQTLYLLQGQIDPLGPEGRGRLRAQGPAAGPLQAEVWLVYRAHTLDWPDEIVPQLLSRVERWRRQGNRVRGIQIDFDVGTRHLASYASFLEKLRQRLPDDCGLSITGLLDWGSNGDPAVLNRLGKTLDEVVVQTYQGRHSIPDQQHYLPRVARLRLPFRIGLVQHGEWQAPADLAGNPWFRGYVVFLLNPR
jgi:hypothetical protein